MSEYVIEQNLISTVFKKVDKDPQGYEKRIVELSKKELQQMIEQTKELGLEVEFYHQEKFSTGIKLIKDGEGLEDIEQMSYIQLKKLLNNCRREIEQQCRKLIKEGKIELIRSGNISFNTTIPVFDILLKYAKDNYESLIHFETLLYIFECVANIDNIITILDKLKEEEIYIYFFDFGVCTAISNYQYKIDDPIGNPISEYFLEDLLFKMHNEGDLTNKEYQSYRILKRKKYRENHIDSKTFDKFIEKYR